MRIARIQTAAGPQYAVDSNGAWAHIIDPFAEALSYTGGTTAHNEATLLAPATPAIVLGIGHNRTLNDHPLPIQAWHKSVHTVAAPGDSITAVRDHGTVNAEGELAVVIGRTASNLTAGNALDHVLGYTCVNDVTNVDQNAVDERNFQGKSGVNYTPLGPWIETDLPDPERVAIDVHVNGTVKATSGTFNLPSTVVDCLVYVTAWLTLQPGDVVMTGAPATVVPIEPGDRVEISVAGIGTLSSPVA
ncbi:fumarylacetoacetate hydrolase family protein [Pseudarthrobacter sp. C4D7]|uniref:fumarylacetoacetate hydrolase family protein n=1 Tax=Pseudarthrobacter sp. C4D7 TaxID=2735268 RepID=UPI00158589ED|nr:fumarylacetoacetate hydrolase family protein [Pseudarthrobacter sp. C4D7]